MLDRKTVPNAPPRGESAVRRLDNVDAMLRGRYAQKSLVETLATRIRNLYPK